MPGKRFSKAEVDYLVAASKFIKYIPEPTPYGSGMRIQIEVYKRAEPKEPIRGSIAYGNCSFGPAGAPQANAQYGTGVAR